MGYRRPANHEDALWLGPRLRQEDQDEIRAGSGSDGTSALIQGLSLSSECHTMVGDDGVPFGMFGLVPTQDPMVAYPWMLATDGLKTKSHSVQFLRQCRAWVGEVNIKHQVLTNLVDSRNELHIKWLKWCGFIFIRRIEHYGVSQLPFYEFVRVSNV